MKAICKTITLPDDQAKWVEEQVYANEFADDSEYIVDLIRRDQDQQNAVFMELKHTVQENIKSGESNKTLYQIWKEIEARYTKAKDSSDICFTHSVIDFLYEYIDYVIDVHGIDEAQQYVEELKECLIRIAQNPRLGKLTEVLIPDLRRIIFQHQIIFFWPRPADILIVHICHHKIGFGQHLLDPLVGN